MQIKWIEIEYAFQFGKKVRIPFPEQFHYAIVGRWKGQPARSNWAGKSNFLRTIKLLKYGKSGERFLSEIPNDKFKNKVAKISGCVEVDGQEIIIHREFKGTSSSLAVEGYEVVDKRVLQQELDRIFGYTYDDYEKTSFFNQGQISQFLEATSTEKLELLNRWLEIKSWEKCYESAKNKLKIAEERIEKGKAIVAGKEQIEESLEQFTFTRKKQEEKVAKYAEQMKEAEANIERLKKEISGIENKSAALKDKRDELKKRLSRSKTIKEMLQEIEDEQAKIKKLEAELEEASNSLGDEDELSKQIEELREEQNSERKRIRNLEVAKEEFAASMNVTEGKCPVDGNECVRLEEMNQQAQENREKYIQANVDIDKIRKHVEELQKQIDELFRKLHGIEAAKERMEGRKNSIYHANRNIQMLEGNIEDTKKLKKELGQIEDELEEAEDKTEEINKLQEQVKEAEHEKDEVDSAKQEANREIGFIDSQVEILNQGLADVTKWEKKLEELRTEKEVLKFCQLMFSKNGIQASQLRSRMDHIEEEVNAILEELDTGFNVRITTERELTTWQGICLECGQEYPKGSSARKCSNCKAPREKKKKEELDIKVLQEGVLETFHQQSGGGKILISLAIRLAIVKLRQQITGKSMGFLALDEIFGMLDKPNRNEVYNFLLNYARNKLGFKQIFSISHLEDNIETDGFIVITKGRKYSEVEFSDTI